MGSDSLGHHSQGHYLPRNRFRRYSQQTRQGQEIDGHRFTKKERQTLLKCKDNTLGLAWRWKSKKQEEDEEPFCPHSSKRSTPRIPPKQPVLKAPSAFSPEQNHTRLCSFPDLITLTQKLSSFLVHLQFIKFISFHFSSFEVILVPPEAFVWTDWMDGWDSHHWSSVFLEHLWC